MENYFAYYAPKLTENGYKITPVHSHSKRPIFDAWQRRNFTLQDTVTMANNGHSTDSVGLVLGEQTNQHYLIAIDIDILHSSVVKKLHLWCLEHINKKIITRIGRAPKIALLVQSNQPYAKRKVVYVDKQGINQSLEILGQGQQILAYGIHPYTSKPYYWHKKREPIGINLKELPLVNTEKIEALFNVFEHIADSEGWVAKTHSKNANDSNWLEKNKSSLDITKKQVGTALNTIKDQATDYDNWIHVGMALYHQFEGNDIGLDYWHKWSSNAYNYEPNALDTRWDSFIADTSINPITFATVLKWAKDAEKKIVPQSKYLDLNQLLAARIEWTWLIEGLFLQGRVYQMHGQWKAGKSLVSLDMAMSLVHGSLWAGRRTAKSLVVCVAGEAAESIQGRIQGYAKRFGLNTDNALFWLRTQPVHLTQVEHAQALQDEIKTFQIEFNHELPVVVIVDTLARNFGSGSESSDEDMGCFINHIIDLISRPLEATVLIIHHSGHSEKERGRGHSSLPAAVDGTLMVSKQDNLISVETTEMRDIGGELEPLVFQVEGEDLEIKDNFDNPISVPVLVHQGGFKMLEDNSEKFGKHEKHLLTILQGMGAIASEVEAEKEFYKQMEDSDLLLKKSSKQKAFNRAAQKMKEIFEYKNGIYTILAEDKRYDFADKRGQIRTNTDK